MLGKTILITGASQGIGEAVARYYSSLGANVVLVARQKEKLMKIKEELITDAYVVPFDLSELEKVEEVFEVCKENGIKLDGMVHCAGVNHDLPIKFNDIDLMKDTMTINYMSFVELAKYFIKKKYSNSGASIVAISSTATMFATAGMCTYSASKAALEASVKVLAKEGTARGLRVNAVAPAFVKTKMMEDAAFANEETILRSQPLGIIEPEYVARVCAFLMSEDAKYITGTVLPITAGC